MMGLDFENQEDAFLFLPGVGFSFAGNRYYLYTQRILTILTFRYKKGTLKTTYICCVKKTYVKDSMLKRKKNTVLVYFASLIFK